METYFSKFPNITYNNVTCKDLSRRVKVQTDPLNSPQLYFAYDIENNLRSDQLAQYYYEDSYTDWMMYLTNGIIDPYYGWYKDQQDFDKFVEKKYGSIEQAIKKIYNYRVNWHLFDIEIPVSVYENNLPYEVRKYYKPNFGINTKVLSYKRRDEDWSTSTNQIVKFQITYNSGNAFTVGELVDIKTSVNTTSNNGVEVISSNSTHVTLKNISGNTSVNNFIVGESSSTNATITSVSYLANNISEVERVYWSAVTYYDYEQEKNEKNKSLFLLDRNVIFDVSEQVRLKLAEE